MRKIYVFFLSCSLISLLLYNSPNLLSKINHIGNSREEAIDNLIFIYKEEGLINTIKKIYIKLNNDPRLSLGYSLQKSESIPKIESALVRDALPQYKYLEPYSYSEFSSINSISKNYDKWSRSNGGEESNKYSSLKTINYTNVTKLVKAWEFTEVHKDSTFLNVETNPIFLDGHIYTTNVIGNLICIDAKLGSKIWEITLPKPVARRGLTGVQNVDPNKSIIYVPTSNGVYSIYAKTGRVNFNFGDNGKVGNQVSLIAPIIADNKLIISIIKPAVKAYDIDTGKLIWQTDLLPKSKYGNDSTDDFLLSGGVPWSGMSYDSDFNRVLVSTGNPRPELLGMSRPGRNAYSDSVVSIDATTGKVIWDFQEIAHDLWDFDVVGSPIVSSTILNGQHIGTVVQVTKKGNVLYLDRYSGKPIFQYRMKKAPVSLIPGEQTFPYQPDLELPESFSKQTFSHELVTDISSKDQNYVLSKIKNSLYGFYQPPVLGSKVIDFGPDGGAEWPGGAVDPKNSILFVPSVNFPYIYNTYYQDLNISNRKFSEIRGNNEYQRYCSSCHGANRVGREQGDKNFSQFVPSLVGITFFKTYNRFTSESDFLKSHINLNLKKTSLDNIYSYLKVLDKLADDDKSLTLRSTWMALTDSNGNPGIKPPWGNLTAINLKTGYKIWQKPLGRSPSKKYHGKPLEGLTGVGSVISTAGNLVFATGKTDSKVWAFNSLNGKELWSADLPSAASAPPMTFMLNCDQYLVVVSTNSLWSGVANPLSNVDKITAFKLNNQNCN
jgi:quinoprotein glucose dehydrogenase